MENARSLIIQAVENTYENIIKKDDEYKKLEVKKSKIINELKMTLKDEDFQKIETLIDCLEGQNFIICSEKNCCWAARETRWNARIPRLPTN